MIKNWLSHFFSFGTTRATLLLDPVVAADMKSGGFASKQAFADWLAQNSKTPAWLYWSTHEEELKKAQQGVEPFASYLKLGEGAEIPVSRYASPPTGGTGIASTNSATPIEIVVVGGGTNTFWSGGDFTYVASASIDHWK